MLSISALVLSVALTLLDHALHTAGEELYILGVGKIKGTTSKSFFTERNIYEFKGIPYAEPPIGEYRFSPPATKKSWDDGKTVVDTSEYGPLCPQVPTITYTVGSNFHNQSMACNNNTRRREVSESEDCLTLDVYTPKIQTDAKMPVMFHIHGGSFIMGTSQSAQPGFLLEHDIVLVAPQYRLGPLGFLCLDIDEVAGNAGLFDQWAALEWVVANIKYFGGDPTRITVSGVSAGAASASLLSISPLSKGSIQSVMLFSGSSLASWAIDPTPQKHSLSIAELSGCNVTDERVECLRTVSATDLFSAYLKYAAENRLGGGGGTGGTSPVVQKAGLKKIIEEKPITILTGENYKAKPLLTGTTKHEGLFLFDMLVEGYLRPNNLINNTELLMYGIGEMLLQFSGIEDPTFILAPAIMNMYFKTDSLGNLATMNTGIIDYMGAAYFKGPAEKTAKYNNLMGGESFVYAFCYEGINAPRGVDHGADQAYIFPQQNANYTEEDKRIIQTLVQFLTNFVIYGNPKTTVGTAQEVINWTQYSQENDAYLRIDSTFHITHNFEEEYIISETERHRNNGASQFLVPCFLLVLFLTCVVRRTT